jgi:hypothetical protein
MTILSMSFTVHLYLLVRLTSTHVWTNHVLPFFSPHPTYWRKHMALVRYELNHRAVTYTTWVNERYSETIQLFELMLPQVKYRSFWLTDNIACLVDFFWDPPHCRLVHILENGIVHCSSCCHMGRENRRSVSFTRGRTMIWVGHPTVSYYSIHKTRCHRRNAPNKEDECFCMWRALLLHSIPQ